MQQPKWDIETDVLVVGYGGAGAVTAITAHDVGAKVLIIEKQLADTATITHHTPNTRMSGGGWLCPPNTKSALRYLCGMLKIANETIDPERKELLSIFSKHLVESTEWLRSIGLQIRNIEKDGVSSEQWEFFKEYPDLPGGECCRIYRAKTIDNLRSGAAFFQSLSDAVKKRRIELLWGTSGQHLVLQAGKVIGMQARKNGESIAIKAKRGIVLTCGGFEYNDWMKENYLRVNPVMFGGNPGNTGDGINIAVEVGSALWHMNCASWRVVMNFSDHPISFTTQLHETASIFVDKKGNRFTNERLKMHAFGYELTNYDCHAMCYPRVPCYWIFDEKRRAMAPLASLNGACNPPGGIPGEIYYSWSSDNKAEIDKGWIMKANTIEKLANLIAADSDNNGLMRTSVMIDTVKKYNQFCHNEEDLDFHKPKEFLSFLEDPPYYAVKLWPGGLNTQGGPKRNKYGMVLRPDNAPINRLYSAGELGSIWGMLYQGGGNLGECVSSGRIAGENVANEPLLT